MAKHRRRTIKRRTRTAGGLETQLLSRGKTMTKKAFNLGKTIVEEFSKEQLKSAVKNMGRTALKPATIRVQPESSRDKFRSNIHVSPPHSHVSSTVVHSPTSTAQPLNARTFKARRRTPESGVFLDLAGKSEVKRTLFE